VTADVLDRRTLNRTTLARQLLLERSTLRPLDAVTHLVGLQAQEPLNPYHALWSRLDGFQADDLSQSMLERRVVRIVAMRGTIHSSRPTTLLCCDPWPSRCWTPS
jgi:hypothetical protein